MNELLSQLLIDFNEAETELAHALNVITDEAGSQHITIGTWSIADCVYHLYQIEMTVLAIIRKQADDTSKLHSGFTIVGREMLREKLLNRTQKVKLPESLTNRMESLPLHQAYKKLNSVRKMLREIITSARITAPELIVPHPVFGDMTKIDWLYSIPFHSLRHTEQILEIRVKLS